MKKNFFFTVLFALLFNLVISADTPAVRPLSSGPAGASVVVADADTDTEAEAVESNPPRPRKLPPALADKKAGGDLQEGDEIDSPYPEIPLEWGKLINAESVKDTSYLIMYFMDNEMRVRVAIWEMGKKKVRLYKLLIFNRGETPLVPLKK